VAAASQSSTKPSDNVVEASKLPELQATGYHAMCANGMHLRIRTAEDEKITCDSAMASAVWKQSRRSESKAGGTVDKMEYVRWIEEILEFNYRTHCVIVLLCSWVSAKLEDSNSKVRRDSFAVWLCCSKYAIS
jgi:hypothetical protein